MKLAASTLNQENPWPGLATFEEADHAFFHGRGAETAQLLQLIQRETLTVLFGRSGLGKTSLLKAGVYPQLRELDYLPVHVRLDHGDHAPPLAQQVLNCLRSACADWQVQAIQGEDNPAPTLWAYFHHIQCEFWSQRNRLLTPVIVFDQFEEIFTLGQEHPAAQARVESFLAELTALVENRPPSALKQAMAAESGSQYHVGRVGVRLVLSFREDFLAAMEALKEGMPSLMYNRLRLLAMDGAQAYAVVVEAGGALLNNANENAVARSILRLAWENKPAPPVAWAQFDTIEIDPALLSVVCSELNLKRQQAHWPQITAALLEGADSEILSGFYERSMAGLDARVRAFVEEELINQRGYRDSHDYQDALTLPGVTLEAIAELIKRRLLRIDERQGKAQARLELTHDVLTRVVADSREQRHEREAQAQLAAEQAAEQAAAAEELRLQALAQAQAAQAAQALAQAQEQAANAALALAQTREQAAQAEQAQAQAQQQRNKTNARWLALGLVLMLMLAGVAWWKTMAARDAVALAEKKTAEAEAAQLLAQTSKAEAILQQQRAEAATKQAQLDKQSAAQASEKAANASRQTRIAELQAANMAQAAQQEKNKADQLLTHAKSVGLMTQADRFQDFQYDLALLLNLEALRVKPTADAQAGLLRRFNSHPHLAAFLVGHQSTAESVAFSPDGKLAASGSRDSTIILWDVARRVVLATLKGHQSPFTSVAFSPDGKTLASASEDKNVILWDVASRTALATLTGHTSDVKSVAFSPDGKTLASASDDNSVMLWAVASRTALATLKGHTSKVLSVAFSPDGKTLASASEDKSVRLWEVASRVALATLNGHERGVTSLAFSPDGKTLASGGGDNNVLLWALANRTMVATLKGHTSPVSSVAFKPDGQSLASASWDKTVMLWDVARRTASATLKGHTASVNSVVFSPDGKSLVSGGNDTNVILWDIANRAAMLKGHTKDITRIVFSQDNKMLASASMDGTVMLWDLASRTALGSLKGHAGGGFSMAFSADGKLLALGDVSNNVTLWDTANRTALATLKGHTSLVVSLAFNADGTTLASGSWDKTVMLWDLANRTALATLKGHTDWVYSVAFSPDGKALASGSSDTTVMLWDVANRTALATLNGHTAGIHSLAFSPDGKALTSNDAKTTIKWNLDPSSLAGQACRTANRNLSCDEWRQFLGPDTPYQKTCPALPGPDPNTCQAAPN